MGCCASSTAAAAPPERPADVLSFGRSTASPQPSAPSSATEPRGMSPPPALEEDAEVEAAWTFEAADGRPRPVEALTEFERMQVAHALGEAWRPRTVCRFYRRGFCGNGVLCPDLHSGAESDEGSSSKIPEASSGVPREVLDALPEVPYVPDKNCDGSCTICYEDYTERDLLIQLHCRHRFHAACLREWLAGHASCPFCQGAAVAAGGDDSGDDAGGGGDA
eukprot:TRINITY_DN7187_c0_g1_i1.p1 TRINITY_DN7187_c0_g1~~TRINITY_DN7187_c0_g1_i1.p1  ORF type:complete len:221 (+),score=41.07 TRINITY_DN7187_c0_g1_i1:56-718(+)